MKQPILSALEQQRAIYINGISGHRPIVPTDFRALAAKAAKKMSTAAYAYIAGGAGLEDTMKENRAAFNRWKIVPRMLRDVSQRDIAINLLGKQLPTPLLTAPIGVLEMAHPAADLAVAKATAKLGIPMIFSNQASVPMEDCAAVMGNSPRWFQLYWSKNDELVASLVKRAERSGCEAIVITLDTTMVGWRPRDLNLGYLPFLKAKGIAQYTSDPVFQQLAKKLEDTASIKPRLTIDTILHLLAIRSKKLGSFEDALNAIRTFTDTYSRPSLNWENLAFVRDHTQLPIFLKGILHPDDARKAVAKGIDGIIVSNHGGRQVDGAISAIAALPDVVAAVDGGIPVLMDSGIRCGADIFKALALGATAVCIGRPYVYGLAIAGELGVQSVLQHLVAELDLTMGLAGCASIPELTKDCLVE